MRFCPKNIFTFVALLTVSLIFVSPAFAAAPDGNGPWADSVFSSSQGLMKNGSAVSAIRSNPTAAVGVAENNTTEGNFFSLGFGGNIALGFDNGISSGVIVVEATNPGYPIEKAKVEVSENGTTWVNAGEVSQGGSVNKPASLGCAKYVRITDISNPNDFSDDTADGYDVDGVSASGEPCTPPPTTDCCCGSTDVNQTNTTTVITSVVSNSNTGNNKAKNNTGGSDTIITGNVKNVTKVAVDGGTNTVTNAGQCCSGSTGKTNITISGNGAGSKNVVAVVAVKQKAPKK